MGKRTKAFLAIIISLFAAVSLFASESQDNCIATCKTSFFVCANAAKKNKNPVEGCENEYKQCLEACAKQEGRLRTEG